MIQVQWLKIYTDIFDNEKIKKLLKNRDVYQSTDKLEKIQEDNRRRQREYRERQKKNNVTCLC